MQTRATHMPAAGLEAARTSSSCRSSNNPLLAQSSSSIDGFLCIDRHGFVELPPSVPCTAHCYAWLDGPAILWGACVDCCGKDGSVETADHTPHQAPGLKIADSGLRINGVKRLPPGQYKGLFLTNATSRAHDSASLICCVHALILQYTFSDT